MNEDWLSSVLFTTLFCICFEKNIKYPMFGAVLEPAILYVSFVHFEKRVKKS